MVGSIENKDINKMRNALFLFGVRLFVIRFKKGESKNTTLYKLA